MINPDKIRLITRFEGRIPHMYLDTRGNVTVAVGQLLAKESQATELPFIDRQTSDPASDQQILTDFHSVRSAPIGRIASFYHSVTRLALTKADMDELLGRRLVEFEKNLRQDFSGFAGFPEPAQEALLDMIFNLGRAGLGRFVKLKAAVLASDWREAALESRRRGISDERNQAIRALFEKAAGIQGDGSQTGG